MKRSVRIFNTSVELQSLVALVLGGVSLMVMLVAFQLNFQQQQLYTQVVRVNESGTQEMMIFRDYRDQQADQVRKLLSDCLERNEIFGDGTGQICDVHRQQLDCVESSRTQSAVLSCLED